MALSNQSDLPEFSVPGKSIKNFNSGFRQAEIAHVYKAAIVAGLRIHIHFIRIRIQHFRLNTDPDPDLQGFNDQKLKKKLQLKKNLIFWIKNYYLPLGLHKERLQHSKEAIQHFKT